MSGLVGSWDGAIDARFESLIDSTYRGYWKQRLEPLLARSYIADAASRGNVPSSPYLTIE
jgi:hypothetical protein